MDICEQRFRAQFREVESLSKKLVLDNLSPRDRHLRRMMLFALRQHTPSDYPFLFRYAACRKEEDSATVKNLAAAVHLLQASITDDILDAGSMRFGRPAFHRQYNVTTLSSPPNSCSPLRSGHLALNCTVANSSIPAW